MKIIADKNIYKVAEYFSAFGDLELIPGREISVNHLAEADVLLTRTVTKIRKELITNTSLRFIGSASSGKDHVDEKLLAEQGIYFCNAPGCNANAVVDYFFAVLAYLSSKHSTGWQDKTVGIIGAGNVGSALARKLLRLGMDVRIYDPLLPDTHDLSIHFCSLQEAIQQDVVTLHTSLSRSGEHATYHLLCKDLLMLMKPDGILINAARGEVVDNLLLMQFCKSRPDIQVALDVWEGEPEISRTLLKLVKVGTPHIAGYSVNGKLNATEKIFNEYCRFFSVDENDTGKMKSKFTIAVEPVVDIQDSINNLILKAYPVFQDFINTRSFVTAEPIAKRFDQCRNTYNFRKEFSDFQIMKAGLPEEFINTAQVLGFSFI